MTNVCPSDRCGDPKCIPCQCEAVRPGSGTIGVCPSTLRRILAAGGNLAAMTAGRTSVAGSLVQAWVKAGEHVKVQQAIKDPALRRDFGRFVHDLVASLGEDVEDVAA